MKLKPRHVLVLSLIYGSLLLAGCAPPFKEPPGASETCVTTQVLETTPTIQVETTTATATSSQPTSTLAFEKTPAMNDKKLPPTETPAPKSSGLSRAIEDLATRLGSEPAHILLVEMYGDEFPAGDLGCPQPGVTPRPIPALVTGQVVILEHDGQRYRYHIRGTKIAYCGQQ